MPCGTQRRSAARPRGKSCAMPQVYVGVASACRSMLRGLKIQSVNCRSYQKKPRGIWWIRGFKMVSASLKKKSHQVRRSRSTVLVTWKRSAKNVDAIASAAYVEQLLPSGKAAVCCILPRGIVWTHLNISTISTFRAPAPPPGLRSGKANRYMRSRTFCMKFNSEQLLFELFFDVMHIFGSVEP